MLQKVLVFKRVNKTFQEVLHKECSLYNEVVVVFASVFYCNGNIQKRKFCDPKISIQI